MGNLCICVKGVVIIFSCNVSKFKKFLLEWHNTLHEEHIKLAFLIFVHFEVILFVLIDKGLLRRSGGLHTVMVVWGMLFNERAALKEKKKKRKKIIFDLYILWFIADTHWSGVGNKDGFLFRAGLPWSCSGFGTGQPAVGSSWGIWMWIVVVERNLWLTYYKFWSFAESVSSILAISLIFLSL